MPVPPTWALPDLPAADAAEFAEYLTELFQTDVAEFYRPSFWPNTHDILPPYLRGRAAFQARLVMAATM